MSTDIHSGARRKVHKPSFVEEPSGHQPNTTAPLCTTAMPTIPPVAEPRKLKPRSTDPQTMNQKPKYSRQPGSKPRGRPRKYPKTGTPADTHNSTPHELRLLKTSQEAAEAYERTKVEKEISRRIEDGNDPFLVTREVLAETDALRMREGEQRLSQASRAQILHEFAGGPKPEPERSAARPVSKPVGRPRKQISYWPSIGAHTFALPAPRDSKNDKPEAAKIASTRARGRRRPLPNKQPLMYHLPSVAAHSWPVAYELSSTLKASQRGEKRARGRLPKQTKPETPPPKYLPSVAAHSRPLLPLDVSPTVRSPREAKEPLSMPLQYDNNPSRQHSAYTATTASYNAPATGTSVGTAYSKVDIGNQSTYPGWELFMSKYYVQQLQTIVRYGSGIFLGVTTNRRKRPCEPRGFRPTVFKLLVFKLPRLKDFPWFLAESVTPEQPHDREKGSQMPKLQIADPKAISPTASLILSHDHRSASTSRDSIAFTDTAVQPVSNHFSPSAAITGKKRKRGTSPQPTRGAALFDPFIRSSHINYPLPQTGPFSASNTPISTSEMAHPSPANDDAGETTKNDEVTGHTPAKQRSARLPSSSPLGASVMEEEQPVSERLTIPCLSPRSTIALIPEASTTDELRAIDHPPIHTSRSFLDFPSVLVPVPSPTDKQLATGGRTTTPSRTSQQSPQSPIPDAYAGDDLLVSKANESPSRTPQPSQYHGQHAKQSRSNTSTIKMSRQGGSAAILRKNIIMGIIDKCEGVFPSYKEMVLPFAAEWKLRGQEGTPEQKTISNAVDSLCKEGKLRQIVFTAQTKYGVAMTKGMLLSASIDATDPKVKEMQAKMVAHHPRYYVPEAVMPSQDPPEGALDRAAERVKKMMDGKAKAAANRLTTLKAQERREAGHADGLDVSSQHWTILSSMYAHSTPITRLPYISRKSFPKRPGGRRGMKRRVERLASLRKPLPARRVPPPLPIPAASLNPLRNPGSLLWLPLDYSFSDYNFEDERPTVLGESSEIGSDHRRAPPDFHVGTFQAPNPLSSSEQAKQRMRMITENAARIERNQKLAKSKKPSLIYPDYDPSHFKSPYAPIRPPSPPKTLRPADALLLPPRPTSHPYPDTPPYPENSTWGETSLLVDVSGHEMPSMAQNKRYSSPPDTVQHRSLKSRRATEPSSPNSPQSVPPGSSITSRADSFGTQYRRALLVDFMDPTHCFHGATGTFSVTFSGILPPRKPRGHNRVDSHGNVLGFKPDQYDLAWANLQKQWQAVEKAPLERQADFLLSWELNTTDLPNVAFKNWPFVNHVFPHFHQTAQAVEADVNGVKEVTFRPRDGRLMNRRFAIPKSIRAKTGDSILSTGTRALPPSTAELGGRHQGKPSLKRRRLTSLVESRVQDGTSEPLQLDPASRPAKSRRIRGPRDATALGENDEERLLTAVMVVRALTGGLEKRIDWVLVAKVFESTHTQVFLHSRWNHIREKYKLVLPRMEAKFQDIFANAYEEGTVPTLNYENLADYDWNWLVEWTVANIDTPIQSLPGLPAERSQLDDLYTLDETTDNDINTYYEIDGPLASGIRTKVINRDPYVCPLFQKRPTKRAGDLEDLATAKSWVRANIITPESTYNPPVARAKLSTFSEQVVEEALKQLLVDKVLAQENKGRLIPGRNYDVSEYFISRLRKNLQPIHYQRATAYKRQLDQIFAEDGCAKYSITADDGDMLAILNLIAHKRIVAVPVDVPMNKWGQTDGGYETRQMDKRRLNFSVELRPLPTYVQGNPLFPLPPPPCQHLQDLRAKIPLWYDIHGLLVGVMWDLALSAVLTVLTIRPGVGPAELEKVVRPAMEVWEVEMVLDWLVMAKAATKVGSGYMVEEWWWLALDHNAGGCNISRESEERGKERTSEEGQDF